MTELDQLVAQVLEPWRVQGETPAWAEVLARAGLAETTRRRRRFQAPLRGPPRGGRGRHRRARVCDRGASPVERAPGSGDDDHDPCRARLGWSAALRLRSSGSPLARDSAGFRFLRTGSDQARPPSTGRSELDGLDNVGGALIILPGRTIRLWKPRGNGAGLFVLRDGRVEAYGAGDAHEGKPGIEGHGGRGKADAR